MPFKARHRVIILAEGRSRSFVIGPLVKGAVLLVVGLLVAWGAVSSWLLADRSRALESATTVIAALESSYIDLAGSFQAHDLANGCTGSLCPALLANSVGGPVGGAADDGIPFQEPLDHDEVLVPVSDATLARRYESTRQALETVTVARNTLARALRVERSRVRALEGEVAELTKFTESAASAQSRDAEKIADLLNQVSTMEAEHSAHAVRLDRALVERDDFAERIAELTGALDATEGSLASTLAKMEQVTRDRDHLKLTLDQTALERDEALAKVDILDHRISVLIDERRLSVSRYEALEKHLDAADAFQERLQSTIEAKDIQLAMATRTIDGLDARIAEASGLRYRVDWMQRSLDVVSTRLDQTETLLTDAELELAYWKDQTQYGQRVIASMQEDRRASEAVRSVIEAQLASALTAVNYTGVQLRREQSLLASSTAGLMALRDEVRERDRVISVMRDTRNVLMSQVTHHVDTRIDLYERLITLTGLQSETLFSRLPDQSDDDGLGGPFVPFEDPPANSGDALQAILDVEDRLMRLRQLEQVVDSIPLVTPLPRYRVTSEFGKRKDPFSGKSAFHQGIDLKAKYKSPIAATAPGIVLRAGWMSGYGRVVDVDHGLGIMTRYAHLAAFKVEKGQRVDAGDVIGLLGNSGRSTGPHLHYEVSIDGTRVDPRNFLEIRADVCKI